MMTVIRPLGLRTPIIFKRMKNVQFCCGGNRIEGWDNHDQDTADITKRLPYGDNTVDFILCEHGLEHVNCGHGFLFLRECHRILNLGGVLRICVPVAFRMPNRDHAIDLIIGHGHQMIYDHDTLAHMLALAGFRDGRETPRRDCDQHWKTIGLAKDDLETLRMEAVK
jgi:predicted SAM-dependent methyltransferase